MPTPSAHNLALQTPEGTPEQGLARYPVRYSPNSTTQISTARLPAPAQLREMSLAFREAPIAPALQWQHLQWSLLAFVVLAPLGVFLAVLLGPVIPLRWALGVALPLGVSLGLWQVMFPRARRWQKILAALVLPPALVLAAAGLNWCLFDRVRSTVLVGCLCFAGLFLRAPACQPLHFFREWLFTHPRLRPETRARRQASTWGALPRPVRWLGWGTTIALALGSSGMGLYPWRVGGLLVLGIGLLRWRDTGVRTRPSLGVFAAVMVAFTYGVAYAPSLIMGLGVLVTLGLLAGGGLRLVRHALPVFLTYGQHASGAAGVWLPEADWQTRRRALITTALSVYLLCNVALICYVPADAIGTYFMAQELKTNPLVTFDEVPPTPAQIRLYEEYRRSLGEAAPGKNPKAKTMTPAAVLPYPATQAWRAALYLRYSPTGLREEFGAHPPTGAALLRRLLYHKHYETHWSQLNLQYPLGALWEWHWGQVGVSLGEGRGALPEVGVQAQPNAHSTLGLPVPKFSLKMDALQHFGIVLGTQLVLCLLIPNGLLLLLYYRPLRQLVRLQAAIDGTRAPRPSWHQRLFRRWRAWLAGDRRTASAPPALDEDGRPQWQWYVDRIQFSPHEAVDPFGAIVQEASHVFLGVEPSLQIPVLLDRKLLSEHAYIVGQTGSGKTTLGITPLLLQLIRGYGVPRAAAPVPALWADLCAQLPTVVPNPGVPALAQLMRQGAQHFLAEVAGEGAALQAAGRTERGAARDFFTTLQTAYGELATQTSDPMAKLVWQSVQRWVQTRQADWAAQPCAADALDAAQGEMQAVRAALPAPTPPQSKPWRHGWRRLTAARAPAPAPPSLSPRVPIVIIDLKGDPALFHTTRAEALARGQEFRFFTPEKGKATHSFNPFVGFASESRTFIQLCHLFLDSLSLNHGEGYGRSYYSRRSRQLLYDALTHPAQPETFVELLAVMTEMSKKAEYQDAFEVLSTVHALSQYPQLITSKEQEAQAPETTINMHTVIARAQICYFWLPSAIESITSKEIGKLALFSLLSAAIDRQHAGLPTQQVYLFIDEFQRLAGENFKIVLEQARAFGVSAILANQALADLKQHDVDLRPTIRTNTRLQLFFSVNGAEEIQELSQLSGEEIRVFRSWSQGETASGKWWRPRTQTETQTETVKNRLTSNDILAISDHPLECIAHCSRGNGYTQFGGQPIRVRTSHAISADLYRERSQAPWPQAAEFMPGDVLVTQQSPREIEDDARLALAREQNEALQSVFGEELALLVPEGKVPSTS